MFKAKTFEGPDETLFFFFLKQSYKFHCLQSEIWFEIHSRSNAFFSPVSASTSWAVYLNSMIQFQQQMSCGVGGHKQSLGKHSR